MAVRIEPHAEPIPGYKLIERLGGGGFGEVWKAEAPGGLHKAIKFVYGDLEALDSADSSQAHQELKALDRVKSVHHPYILSLERYDIIEGQLLIVMELADRTLWDRFKECRTQGMPGIPRAELLHYMQETADALDFMNSMHQLQHLDIKPQNLFLVYNHVKVADFGLVKAMGGRGEATITGGSTPVYAAPETFDGWLSRFTDQYSLAIVYQELLTGQRPFAGNSIRQLVMQHLQGEPDLRPLPVADRPPIARALAKKPDDRFPSCLDMVLALRGATLPAISQAPAPEKKTPSSEMAQEETPGDKPVSVGLDNLMTRAARGKQPRQVTPIARGTTPADSADRPQVMPPRPRKDVFTEAQPSLPAPQLTGVTRTSPVGKPKSAPTIDLVGGVLQPGLVIGLGQLGLTTLQQLRKYLSQEFGSAEAVPQVRLLGIDADADSIRAAGQGDAKSALRNSEVILAKLQRASHYLKPRDGKLPHASWLNSKLLYRLGKQTGAGARALGRLAIVDHARVLGRRLEMELQASIAQDTPHEGTRRADLGLRCATPRVYIIAGLAGQTGSGMLLDVAYLVRSALRRQGLDSAEVIGLFYLPPAGRQAAPRDLATSVAALKEIDHFTAPDAVFAAEYETNDPKPAGRRFTEHGPAFQRCLFLQLPEKKTQVPGEVQPPPEAVSLAGHYLFRELATPLGKAVDEARRTVVVRSSVGRLASVGLFRYIWPRRELVEQASRGVCRRIVERWMAKTVQGLTEAMALWTESQWEGEGMRPENLIARHQESCAQLLQQDPDRLISGMINPLSAVLGRGQAPGEASQFAPVVQAMAGLSKLLGCPEDCRQQAGPSALQEPGTIEKALSEAAWAIAEKSDQQLAVWIVSLIEDPRYRLAGAEEALRQFTILVERALQSQEQLTKELQERAVALFQRLGALLDGHGAGQAPTTSGWKTSFTRKNHPGGPNFGPDLLDLIKSYAKCRYHSMILGHINRLFVSLRGHLSDQLREVGFCRQRLGELAGIFASTSKNEIAKASAREEYILPDDSKDLQAAVLRLEEKITAKDLLDLDQRMQKVVEHNCRALVEVCMGPSSVVRNLAPLMQREVENYLEQQLTGASVAEMFLRQKATPGSEVVTATQALAAAYDEAGSGLVKEAAAELAVAALPADAHGQRLQSFLKSAMPQVRTILTPRADEIVFLREEFLRDWSDLDQLGHAALEAYQQRLAVDPSSLHCRDDFPFVQPAAEPAHAR